MISGTVPWNSRIFWYCVVENCVSQCISSVTTVAQEVTVGLSVGVTGKVVLVNSGMFRAGFSTMESGPALSGLVWWGIVLVYFVLMYSIGGGDEVGQPERGPRLGDNLDWIERKKRERVYGLLSYASLKSPDTSSQFSSILVGYWYTYIVF